MSWVVVAAVLAVAWLWLFARLVPEDTVNDWLKDDLSSMREFAKSQEAWKKAGR